MDFDALFAMPNSMPGYYDIEDGFYDFYANDGRLYIRFLLNFSLNFQEKIRMP